MIDATTFDIVFWMLGSTVALVAAVAAAVVVAALVRRHHLARTTVREAERHLADRAAAQRDRTRP